MVTAITLIGPYTYPSDFLVAFTAAWKNNADKCIIFNTPNNLQIGGVHLTVNA